MASRKRSTQRPEPIRDRTWGQAVNPNVISVGASNSRGNVTSYSNRGSTLDLVAPGGDASLAEYIYQETVEGVGSLKHAYVGYLGTSMAAPHVTGTIPCSLRIIRT